MYNNVEANKKQIEKNHRKTLSRPIYTINTSYSEFSSESSSKTEEHVKEEISMLTLFYFIFDFLKSTLCVIVHIYFINRINHYC